MSGQDWKVWGIDLSLFTGKVEAIMRAKGLPYKRHLITGRNWPHLARKVGVQHMPYVEMPNGDFLSDTTLTLRWLEDGAAGPTLCAAPGHARFMARLIEDWADEYLWRPAMYYRWWVRESKHMSSRRIAEQIGQGSPLPLWVLKRIIMLRQYYIYVRFDGVRTAAQRRETEALYLRLLDELDAIFAKRPFLMGNRPTEADFGLFAPFFRHFFGDPVPGPIMQDRARHVLLWAARMWALKPEDFQDQPVVDSVPEDLNVFFSDLADVYIPYLRANADAVASGQKWTHYTAHGLAWKEYAKPFRLWCLADMQAQFGELDAVEQAKVRQMLGEEAVQHLMATLPVEPVAPPALPITSDAGERVDSWMR